MAYTRPELAVLRQFGERVRRAREARGWTQEKLAEEAGLDRTYVGGVERGERNIALLNMNKISVALGEGFAGFLPCRPGRRRT
jgi:transcriptional regulator with XRE-family HTH domain